MLITVVATLCLAGTCTQHIVTDQATLMQCGGAFAQQALAGWMEQEGWMARGYRLAKWGCVVGGQKGAVL